MACPSCRLRMLPSLTKALSNVTSRSATSRSMYVPSSLSSRKLTLCRLSSAPTRQYSLLCQARSRLRPSISSTQIPTSATTSLHPPSDPLHAALQVREASRAGMYNPSHLVRKRRGGFLARLRTAGGRKVLKRRKARGRHKLSH